MSNSGTSATSDRVELDEILHTQALPPDRVKAWFRQGDWDKEEYLVQAIKRHLLYGNRKRLIANVGLSTEDILNGRYAPGGQTEVVNGVFHEWNTWLGFYCFGPDGRRQGTPYPPPAREWTDDEVHEIIRQAEMADYIEIKTSGCADSESWGDSVRFRWFRSGDGLEVVLDNPYEGDLVECQIDIADLRKMRIDGNTLIIMANDGTEDDDGVLVEEDKFEIGITLMRKEPLNIIPPPAND
jgi:hypothetical protein